jgi:predicted DNA binding CopG/RHH family protein
MTNAEKADATASDWDARKLGHDEQFVKRARKSHEDALDNALGLQMISVRLQKQLISDLKFIATAHGIGYQPLIRDILSRFVAHEKKQIMREAVERRALELQQKEQEAQAEAAPRKQRRVA